MRVNVYSQELTDEVVAITKVSGTGREYHAAQLVLHSSERLHHPPADDDRSAVTFWLPSSPGRRERMAVAFERIAQIFRNPELAVAFQKQRLSVYEALVGPVYEVLCCLTVDTNGWQCRLVRDHLGKHQIATPDGVTEID